MDDLTVSFLKNGIQKLSEQFITFTCYIISRNSMSSSFTEIDKKMCLYFLIDSEEGFYDKKITDENYPDKDFHYMYIGKIFEVLEVQLWIY